MNELNDAIRAIEEKGRRIYLDEPVYIKGIRIGHTKHGLVYMIEHYTNMIHRFPSKFSKSDLDHIDRMLTNYKQHLELYKSQEKTD